MTKEEYTKREIIEQWIVEAERNAKYLAKMLYKRIINEADDICVDQKWYLKKSCSVYDSRK